MTAHPPRPEVKAFLVCDQMLHDGPTNKRSLIGVFHDLGATQFPAMHPSLWLYANLTDAHGRYDLELRFMDIERNHMLGGAKPPPIEIGDPRQTAELSAQLRNLTLPGPGTYEFHLIANGELLATKAIRVFKMDAQGRRVTPHSSPPTPPPEPPPPSPPVPPPH
jgi:hypothetical protein